MAAELLKVAMVTGALFVFGVGYNRYVAELERDGRDRGYTAILVVIGVGITLIGATVLVGPTAALWVMLCFAASGAPMVYGSISRYQEERRQEECRQAEKALAALSWGESGGDES